MIQSYHAKASVALPGFSGLGTGKSVLGSVQPPTGAKHVKWKMSGPDSTQFSRRSKTCYGSGFRVAMLSLAGDVSAAFGADGWDKLGYYTNEFEKTFNLVRSCAHHHPSPFTTIMMATRMY